MKLRWSRSALADLRRIRDWLSTLENTRPNRTIHRIREAAARLESHDAGRPSRLAGARELSALDGHYVVIYRIERDLIRILAVYHTAQDR